MWTPSGLHSRATLLLVLIGWLIGGGLFFLLRFIDPGVPPPVFAQHKLQIVPVWLFLSISIGLLHFGAIVISDSRSFRQRSYGFFILFQLVFVFIAYLITLSLSRFMGVFTGSYELAQVGPVIRESLTSWSLIGGTLFILVWSGTVTFARQMMVKVGPNVLLNLMLGKYHKPRIEDRIFLFVDLKSSTRIAKKLGHAKYARFIQDCFVDLTDSLIKYDVEVYQYIGDEAVLTWRLPDGLRRANCVRVYFDFIHKLRSLAPAYREKYGESPFFKAGLNVGPVTVSEIGVVKREIAYLSEVLHTAARIQSQCNIYGQGLLLSKAIKEMLEGQPGVGFTPVAQLVLSGKSEEDELFAVSVDGETITY